MIQVIQIVVTPVVRKIIVNTVIETASSLVLQAAVETVTETVPAGFVSKQMGRDPKYLARFLKAYPKRLLFTIRDYGIPTLVGSALMNVGKVRYPDSKVKRALYRGAGGTVLSGVGVVAGTRATVRAGEAVLREEMTPEVEQTLEDLTADLSENAAARAEQVKVNEESLLEIQRIHDKLRAGVTRRKSRKLRGRLNNLNDIVEDAKESLEELAEERRGILAEMAEMAAKGEETPKDEPVFETTTKWYDTTNEERDEFERFQDAVEMDHIHPGNRIREEVREIEVILDLNRIKNKGVKNQIRYGNELIETYVPQDSTEAAEYWLIQEQILEILWTLTEDPKSGIREKDVMAVSNGMDQAEKRLLAERAILSEHAEA